MALLGASRVAVTPERSPPGASVAMPWAGSPGLRERPVVAMGKAGQEGKMPTQETTSRYGEQERGHRLQRRAHGVERLERERQ